MISSEVERACMNSLDRWMAALNVHDADAMDQEMHFPHVRLAADSLYFYEAPGSNPMNIFTTLIKDSGWHHSIWIKRVPVQASDTKVHIAVSYTRFAQDGSVIGTYESLYVMTLKDGAWKTQIRSSLGP